MDETLTKLEQLLKLIQSGVSKDEFVEAFERVLELILKIEKRNSEAVSMIEQSYKMLMDRMQNDHTSAYSDLKGKVDQVFVGERLTEMKKIIDDRIAKVKDGRDGSKGDKGDKGRDGRDGSPDLPDQIVSKINNASQKIKKEQVEGIKELEEKVGRVATSRTGGRGGRKTTFVKRVNLSSQLNGVLKTFTLPQDTIEVLGVWGTQFPINFNPGTDWTFAGRTLTLTDQVSAPETGQTLYALVESLFY